MAQEVFEVTYEVSCLVTINVTVDSDGYADAESEAGYILSSDENKISEIFRQRALANGAQITDITWGIDESPQSYSIEVLEDEDDEDEDDEEE